MGIEYGNWWTHDHRAFAIAGFMDDLARLASALDRARSAFRTMTVQQHRQFAERQVLERGALTRLSAVRIFGLWRRFEAFLAKVGVHLVGEITPSVVHRWVYARCANGDPPAPATVRTRVSALRLLFREWRQFGLFEGDPTLDFELPSRPGPGTRPLSDEEVERAEWASLTTVLATREPSIWALAEAGGSTTEIGQVAAADLRLDTAEVRFAGGPRTNPHIGVLTEWGVRQLSKRVRTGVPYLASDSVQPRTANGCAATVTDVLRRAGLADRCGVSPRSVTAWAGVKIFERTRRVEDVATGLGWDSLDRVAALITHDWRNARPESR